MREFIRAIRHGYQLGGANVPPPDPTPGGAVRDPFFQPFDVSSIWNTSLGSGAIYRDALLLGQPDNANQFGFVPAWDNEMLFLSATNPRLAIFYSSAAWTGANRCTPTQAGTKTAVPCAATYYIENSGSNNCAAFLMTDSRTITQLQPFTHCSPNAGAGYGGTTATVFAFFANQDLYGMGIGGSHGGSGLSTYGGSIRMGEVRPGDTVGPAHVLHVNVFGRQFYFRSTISGLLHRWPADRADGYSTNSTSGYGSWNGGSVSNSDMVSGSLVALLPSWDCTAQMETTPGRLISWTLREYGAYIVDDVGVAGFAYGLESGPAGTKAAQFSADWHYAFNQHEIDNTAWRRDCSKICDNLYVITNNGPPGVPMKQGWPAGDGIGGGGTRRQPPAPAIAP